MTFIVSLYRRSPTLIPSEASLEDLENSRRAICQASRLRIRAALLRSHRPRRDRAAHPLSRRRSAQRQSRAAHAWRAVVVVPLSPDNRESRRARPSRGRAGLIGLRLVAAFPERFARVVVANTGLPTGEGFSEGFKRWLEFSQSAPVLPIG